MTTRFLAYRVRNVVREAMRRMRPKPQSPPPDPYAYVAEHAPGGGPGGRTGAVALLEPLHPTHTEIVGHCNLES